MSKIESGQMTVETISVNPAQIAEESVSLLRPQAIQSSLTMQIEYTSAVPERIMSDPTRLRQILINLLGNAIKFTHEGGIKLEVSCDRDRRAMVFKIIDTGIGMTPEQRDLVAAFEPFVQGDSSRARKYGGTGLGLRISNDLAKLLGGGVAVESTKGVGSCFTVTVQAEALDQAKWLEPDQVSALLDEDIRKEQAISSTPTCLQAVRILVVDDAVDNQRLIRHRLQQAGAYVRTVGNGQLALDLVKNSSKFDCPQIILMDMQMPEMDGYTAARLLREGGYDMPIVAITAHAMQGDEARCVEAGCNHYLTKPLDFARLIEICVHFETWSTAA